MKQPYENVDLAASTMALIKSALEAPEIGRRAFPAYVLSRNGGHSEVLIKDKEVRITQHKDGGWSNVLETIWISVLCRERQSMKDIYLTSISWLRHAKHNDGGWGTTERDISRIPVSGLLLNLLPELSDQKAVSWLQSEWRKDFNSNTRLTYKGAFFLLGLHASDVFIKGCPLIKETYSYLASEQNDDGGFAPWKDHPIGSEPWSTGIVLLGLLAYKELTNREVIEKAVNWLIENQLPNGLWPYHYIEEGSAWAFWGLVEALKYLEMNK